MKPTSEKSKAFKVLLTIALALIFISPSMKAQDFKKFAVGPGIRINIGVFNPEAVNNFIANQLSSYSIVFGSTDLILYEEVGVFLNFKTRWVDISPVLDYAISPKIVVGAEDFYFTRVSPGVLANFFIPTGLSGKTAFFVGGGLQLHALKLSGSDMDPYTCNDLGIKLQLGYDLQFGHFNLQPVIAFNMIQGLGESTTGSLLDLNYTGGSIGVNMSFHKPVSHRRF